MVVSPDRTTNDESCDNDYFHIARSCFWFFFFTRSFCFFFCHAFFFCWYFVFLEIHFSEISLNSRDFSLTLARGLKERLNIQLKEQLATQETDRKPLCAHDI
ncbi:MAG: hypothetical protein FP810_07035 [Desulfocapsa sp.]|nr:hypothetical protein [Desulfocapsa sp.]